MLPQARFASEPSLQCDRYPFSSLGQCGIVEVNVPIGRTGPTVPKQASRDMQAFAVHDRVRGVRMAQVMQPRIRYDSGHVARRDPERVEGILGQRLVSVLAGEHPFPGRRFGKAVQQLPRRLAKQNVPRSSLRVNQRQPVRLDLAPAQAAYLARPAPRQQEQPHRRDADRGFLFAQA